MCWYGVPEVRTSTSLQYRNATQDASCVTLALQTGPGTEQCERPQGQTPCWSRQTGSCGVCPGGRAGSSPGERQTDGGGDVRRGPGGPRGPRVEALIHNLPFYARAGPPGSQLCGCRPCRLDPQRRPRSVEPQNSPCKQLFQHRPFRMQSQSRPCRVHNSAVLCSDEWTTEATAWGCTQIHNTSTTFSVPHSEDGAADTT